MSESHEIFVRAHTVVSQKERQSRPSPAKWPDEVLVIDSETTINAVQKLNFGVYRRCKRGPNGYECVEEGLFYADDLERAQREIIEQYVNDPKNLPGNDVRMFPPQIRLKLYSRSDFVERVFWKAIRNGAMVVGFNLPFDISRLAVKACPADEGGWSLVLSMRKSRRTAKMEPNPERPRIVIYSINGRAAFISLKAIKRPQEWKNTGGFLDLHTFGWSLRNEPYGLRAACERFSEVPPKMKHDPTGRVTAEEVDYCRQDVRSTTALLNAMKREFDQHPIDLDPRRSYSPASIAKSYLDAMHIEIPRMKLVPDSIVGKAMQTYYGGRAECRTRMTSVPIVLTDFTSQYPTVNALLGNWAVLTAESITFDDCTEDVRKMLARVNLQDLFDPAFWKQLSFFALVQPQDDILPVRTLYNGRTHNIGLNYLTSAEPIWFAGPDLVASALLTGKPPRILKAIRMVPHGRQSRLKPTNLAGMVAINPKSDDFFCHVIEQKTAQKSKNKSVSNFLKTLANSGSYGLFVEVNQENTGKPVNVKVFSGEISGEKTDSVVEKPGPWYFPPLASLITAGGRLLLAMLEKCVIQAAGSYLFCDTDSLCIISSEDGRLVPCPGGDHKLEDGREAVKALSWKEVDAIAGKFNALNPYNWALVKEILKIEDINFVDSDPHKRRRQLFGYAISAKRYALYVQKGDDIEIVKASGHGLGYLYAPKNGFNQSAKAPEWVVEAWDWLLRKELGLPSTEPAWLDLPAMMRMALTSPNVMRYNRPEWLAPFNFFLLPLLSDLGGYPAGCDRSNFKFIAPFNSDREQWCSLEGINLVDEQPYSLEMVPNGKQDKVVPESFRIMLRMYLRRPESKSLAPDGSPCVGDTKGVLRRAAVVASDIVPVGKETDRHWEQGEDMSLVDFKVLQYRPPSAKMMPADDALRKQLADLAEDLGMRKLITRVGLSQHTLEAILKGKAVRRATLERAKQFITQSPNLK
jgi:hypothetical protein